MTVRLRLALTIFITGALTALGVIATVAGAFERFEHELTYYRANAFLDRVLVTYDDVLELQARNPEEFVPWLKSLLLFEPDTQLYLLRPDGTVLASTGTMKHQPGYKVTLPPVQQALTGMSAVAAGLVVATGLKMAAALPRRWRPWLFAALALAGVGVLRFPLFGVLGVLGPVAVALAWRDRR